VFAALDAQPREHSRQRQNPERQVHASDRPRSPRSRPRREIDRFCRWDIARLRPFHQLPELPDVARFGKRSLVDAGLERVLERDHQLHAFERAQPELFERRL